MRSSFQVSFPFTITVLCFAIIAHLAHPQDSPVDYVNAHNVAKSAVGIPPLAWDDIVAQFAQDYANQCKGDCQLVHFGGHRRYDENLAWSFDDLSSTKAMEMWVNEKANYDNNNNSCIDGESGHYTQGVWRDSTRVGYAKVSCDNGKTFIGCNYDPPGNYVRQSPY